MIYIIGIGPGDAQFLTAQAKELLEKSDVIVGYTVYVDLVKAIFPNKISFFCII